MTAPVGAGLRRGRPLYCVLSGTRNHSIGRKREEIDADQCVRGADQLPRSVRRRARQMNRGDGAGLDLGVLVCHVVRCDDLAVVLWALDGGRSAWPSRAVRFNS